MKVTRKDPNRGPQNQHKYILQQKNLLWLGRTCHIEKKIKQNQIMLYLNIEQPVQSQSLQKCTEDNLELLTRTEHIQTKTIKKKINNQYLEKKIKHNQIMLYLNSQYNHHC